MDCFGTRVRAVGAGAPKRAILVRVTTCSRLLLVELEDLNPYLSLLEVDAQTRAQFMKDFVAALEKAANETQNIGI